MTTEAMFRGVVPRKGGFSLPDHWVWCGAPLVGEDGRFHLFASRWSKALPFHPGWLTSSEIVRAVSHTPTGPYELAEVVLPARGAGYWDGRMTHNPAIIRCGDTYVLFYTGSTHPFDDVKPNEILKIDDPRVIVARSNKRIGVATAPSPEGPWTRSDAPILPTAPGTFYSFLTSNPTPCMSPDGSMLLVFKARRYEGSAHSSMALGVAVADSYRGPYRVIGNEPVVSQGAGTELEDPFIWHQDGIYHLIAKDMTGEMCGEECGGVHARSDDGIHWEWSKEKKAYSRSIEWDDGTLQILGSFERPSLLLQGGKPTYLFGAVADGPGHFTRASHTWNLAMPIGGAPA